MRHPARRQPGGAAEASSAPGSRGRLRLPLGCVSPQVRQLPPPQLQVAGQHLQLLPLQRRLRVGCGPLRPQLLQLPGHVRPLPALGRQLGGGDLQLQPPPAQLHISVFQLLRCCAGGCQLGLLLLHPLHQLCRLEEGQDTRAGVPQCTATSIRDVWHQHQHQRQHQREEEAAAGGGSARRQGGARTRQLVPPALDVALQLAQLAAPGGQVRRRVGQLALDVRQVGVQVAPGVSQLGLSLVCLTPPAGQLLLGMQQLLLQRLQLASCVLQLPGVAGGEAAVAGAWSPWPLLSLRPAAQCHAPAAMGRLGSCALGGSNWAPAHSAAWPAAASRQAGGHSPARPPVQLAAQLPQRVRAPAPAKALHCTRQLLAHALLLLLQDLLALRLCLLPAGHRGGRAARRLPRPAGAHHRCCRSRGGGGAPVQL
jgi:hypothetical protein